jgi:multidrug efflux system membrane fusion protein
MRIRSSFVIAVTIAALITLWMASGIVGGDSSQNGQDDAEATAEAAVVSVRVATVTAQRRDASLIIRGQTEALRKVTLRAETQGSIAELPIERGQHVVEGDIICQIAVNDREARLEEARALVAQREAEYLAAQELGERGFRSDIQRAGALAARDSARATLRAAEVELERTRIRAPFDGILDVRDVNVGDYMSPGAACGVVVDQDPFLIVGHVSERDVGSLTLDGPGIGRLIDGTRVQGRIRFIGTQADPATRTFRIELEVSNEDELLRDGVTSNIVVPVRSVEAHLISPAVLSLSDLGEIGVKTVDDNNVVQFMPVEVIEDAGDGFWVRGLPHTARVIVVGQEYVIEGERINPVDVTAEVQS